MCLILLNMHLLYWILVLMMSLSLRVLLTCTQLDFPVSCWLGMASKKCCIGVGSFLPMLRIQTFVLFLSGNEWYHGMLFSDWEMYYMLWCSQCCVVISMGLPLGVKLTLSSNILSLIKVWSERSIVNVGGVEIFVPSISPDPGDQPLQNLFLCSSMVSDEKLFQYLYVCVPVFHCGSAICVTH